MELKNYFAQDELGNALPDANCFLYVRGTEHLVTGLQTANGEQLGNPFTADGSGLIQFSAPDGLYDLRVTKHSRDYRIHVQLMDLNGAIVEASAQADRATVEADRSEAAVDGLNKFSQVGAGAVVRELHEKLREQFSVKDFGAKGDGVTDDTAAINAAVAALLAGSTPGGRLYYPAGTYIVSSPILLDSGIHHEGAGRRATIIQAKAGSNTDIFKTRDFDILSGGGNINEAPYGYSISSMTLEGNYLDLGIDQNSWRTVDVVLNQRGCGIRAYGSMFDYDVEINNVAENALYCEGQGNYYPNQEHASRIRITGRISGKDGIIYRGPGDIFMEYVVLGLCGLLPLSVRKQANQNMSNMYPDENVTGLVLDNNSPHQGHVEIGMVHIYAAWYNYGLRTIGVNRFNVDHIVVENCLGGYYLGDGAHGVIGALESRVNGRYPDAYVGTGMQNLEDIVIDNGKIWQITGQMRVYRYSPSRDLSGYSVRIMGNSNNLTLTYASQLQADELPLDASFLEITGNYNNINFQAMRVKGNAVYVSGVGNSIRGVCTELYGGTLLTRDGSAAYANMIDINGIGLTNECTAFSSTGTASSESIRMTASGIAGYTPFVGDRMAALNRTSNWQIMCTNGNGINGKSTEDYLEYQLPMPASAGIFEVELAHNFLYAPTRNQINWDFYQAGTEAVGASIEWFRLIGEPTATSFKVRYKWSGVPVAGSPPIVMFHIR